MTLCRAVFSNGIATADMARSEQVQRHNLSTWLSSDGDYRYAPPAARAAPVPAPSRTFAGYLRPDGRVGTRNEIWILPTVGCVGNLAARVARIAGERHAGRIDGVHAFKHPFGCSQLGDRSEEHTSELQSLMRSSYAVFCLNKKYQKHIHIWYSSNTYKKLHN